MAARRMKKSGKWCVSESPITKKMAEDKAFIKGLDNVQLKFDSTMDDVFKKFDRPFDLDIDIYMEDLSYDTPTGRRPWTFKTKPEVFLYKKKKISEADDCEEAQPTMSELQPVSGQTSTALMRSKENPYTDDRKRFDTTPNGALMLFNKTIPAGLPLKATVSNMSFIDLSNKKVHLKFLGKSNVVALIADDDDDETSDNEETSFSEPGNTTLEDFYPQMIRNMSRFWKLNLKNKAASNIVQHYRRQMWCKPKLMGKTTYPAPRVGKTTCALDFTLQQDELLSRSAFGDPVEIQNPCLILHKLGDPVVSFTHQNLSNSNKTCECIVGNRAVYRDSPLPRKLHKEGCVTALFYSSRASSDFCKMSNSTRKSITNEGQMDVDTATFSMGKDMRQQHIPSLSRKSFSGFSMLQSPNNNVAKANCNITRSPSRYLTSQTLVNVDKQMHESYKEQSEQEAELQEMQKSNFSGSDCMIYQSPNKLYENVYKELTQTRCPDVSLGKANVPLTNTFSSLVHSPGSVTAKRPLSYDFSFSTSKKPRSAAEAIISTSKPSSHGSPKWSQSRSPPCHSVVGSALLVHMWPHSAGSQSDIYRKLTYQEDDN